MSLQHKVSLCSPPRRTQQVFLLTFSTLTPAHPQTTSDASKGRCYLTKRPIKLVIRIPSRKAIEDANEAAPSKARTKDRQEISTILGKEENEKRERRTTDFQKFFEGPHRHQSSPQHQHATPWLLRQEQCSDDIPGVGPTGH